MKKLINIITLVVLSFSLLTACEEDYEHKPFVKNTNKPKAITNVDIAPLHGGVKLTYNIPNDKDILYVQAEYTNSKGEKKNVKSSVYKNSLTILGYGNVTTQKVTLYTVNRSETLSEPYQVSFTPLEPPVNVIKNTMDITTDFGGARYTWANKERSPISILLLSKSDRGKIEVKQTVYTSQSEQSFSIRGFDTIPRLFAAVIRDRYDNFSDTIYAKTPNKMLTPLYEEKIDKSKFKKLIFPNDTNWDAWEGDYTHFYDDKIDNFIHSQGNHPAPQIFSIDLGQVIKPSRFKVYQRSLNEEHFAYTHGNPKTYVVYGAKELPNSDSLDEGSGWIKLRECESIKPSGSPIGTNTDEDMDHFRAGDEYSFEDAPPIRYFRIAFYKTWDGAGFLTASEFTIWGSVEKK